MENAPLYHSMITNLVHKIRVSAQWWDIRHKTWVGRIFLFLP